MIEPPPIAPSILKAIGNTPVVRLSKIVPSSSADVLVKLEYFNPTCSYKDRMALAIIEQAEARGDLRPGMTVVEYTGGSTGSSLALVCTVKGYRCRLVSSDAFAKEKRGTMEALGAEVLLEASEGGQVTPELVQRMIQRAESLAAEDGTYFTNQFHNPDAFAGYQKLGQELIRQAGRGIDAFCGGVGTAGMLMGVAGVLKEACPEVRIVALEPATSALLSGGEAGAHRVEGIGVGFRPPLLERELYDEARGIDEGEARKMARLLAREEGIFAGTSTGLNVVAAIQLATELGEGKTVATVAVDTGLKYLASDLFRQ